MSRIQFNNLIPYLLAPQPVLSMALVRIALGLCVMWQAAHKGLKVFSGTAQDGFHFTYQFFDWVQYSPEHAALLALCWFLSGLAFATGFMFRITAPLCTLLTIYQYVIAAEEYLNHEYMEILFLLLMSLGPAHHRLSIDNLIWRFSGFAPKFHLLTLQIQTEIILIYAGLVKINSDWLHLQPLSNWLLNKVELVSFGSLWGQEWAIAIGAYGIILLHVFGAPLLFFKKTRVWIFCLYVPFHVINSIIFPIDIFPWMTIAATTLFFEPDWPKRIFVSISDKFRQAATRLSDTYDQKLVISHPGSMDSMLMLFFALWLFFQAVIPLRSLLYPGPVDWTSEGYRFAWRMMLAQKTCTVIMFVLTDAHAQFVLLPDTLSLVNKDKLALICRESDYILQFAHQLRERYVHLLNLPPETRIQAAVIISNNYRVPSLYTDPMVDLGKEELSLRHYSWIRAHQKLGPLPPPFKSFVKSSEVFVLDELFKLPDIQNNYACQPLNAFNEKEGRGVYCKRIPERVIE